MAELAIGLLHWPIRSRSGQVTCTNLTNFDLHDLARLARTYCLPRFYLVHPYPSQRLVAHRILSYWRDGKGGEMNPDRREAMGLVRIVSNLAEAAVDLEGCCRLPPWTVYTDARSDWRNLSYPALRRKLRQRKAPCLLVFGTGWGIEPNEMIRCDYFLQPIAASSDYNHLSVRSAASIIVDRIFRSN
jgi:hypothetical protein